jgi:hypothetical protein
MRFDSFRSAGVKTYIRRRAGWYPIGNNKKGGILGDILFEVIATVLAILIVGVLYAFPVMWIWNAVIPSIFGLPTIGFGQAAGLVVISKLLFYNGSLRKKDD